MSTDDVTEFLAAYTMIIWQIVNPTCIIGTVLYIEVSL